MNLPSILARTLYSAVSELHSTILSSGLLSSSLPRSTQSPALAAAGSLWLAHQPPPMTARAMTAPTTRRMFFFLFLAAWLRGRAGHAGGRVRALLGEALGLALRGNALLRLARGLLLAVRVLALRRLLAVRVLALGRRSGHLGVPCGKRGVASCDKTSVSYPAALTAEK